MNVIQNLRWRYATKAMNGQQVPQEKVDYILEAIQLSASSSGLQPYEVLVVTDPEIKQQLRKVAWDQSQLTDSSHVLVFAAWDQYTEERVNRVFARNNKERGLPDSATDDYRKRLLGIFAGMSTEQQFNHAAKQAYIALGSALVAAAEQKVDSTPMEGFSNAEVDRILNLAEKGLKSVIVLPLGYRDENKDWLVNMKKVRTPKEELVTVI